MFRRRDFLAVTASAGVLRSQPNGTPPPGPSGPVRIEADRPTLLMGDEASIRGGIRPQIVDHGAKRLQVRNWLTADDSFTWQVEAPAAGEFSVTALTQSKGAVLEIKSGGERLERAVTTGWDRICMGRLTLARGTHELTLRAVQPGEHMEFYSLELIAPALERTLAQQARETRSDTAWMRRARYGVQFHWTSRTHPRRGPRLAYAEAVRNFPAGAFADSVQATGAGYVILTTSHAEHFFPAPIQAINRTMPGRTTERDLVRDWIEALGKHGIRLMLYYHAGHDDWKDPAGWWARTGFEARRPGRFLDNWCAITSEVGRRYGKDLAGWFFDDACVYYPLNPDFRRLTQSAKTGNPDRVICYNPWVLPRATDFQDYLCGEGYQFLKLRDNLPADGTGIFAAGPHRGLQAHTNFILEQDWCHDRADTDIAPPRYPKEQFIEDMKAGIARGIVPSVNLEICQDGRLGPASVEYMRSVREAVKG